MLICTALLIVRTEPTRAATVTASTPAVGMARTSNNEGYWIATQDGAVYSFGNAVYHGGANQFKHSGTIVGLVTTSTDGGYWEVGSDGGVYAFGDARFYGLMAGQSINAPIVGIARTPTNGGYWLVGADGGVYAFGDARFYGSMAGQSINAPISGMVATSTGQGYWLVGRDGGVYAFGDARFYGSMGGQHLNAPIVGIDRTSANGGYWLVGADGGIFSFGNAGFHGSMGGQHLNVPMVGLAAISDNGGYWGVAGDGGIFAFGTAQYYGNVVVTMPLNTAQALAQQILANARIDKSGRDVLEDLQDAAAGKVATAHYPLSATLLHLIVVLGQSHSFQITALESGGTGHSTNSYHYTGDAIDIDLLDGQPVTGRNAPSLTIINALASLLPYGSAFGQSNCGKTPPLPPGITSFSDYCTHLHIQVPRTSP